MNCAECDRPTIARNLCTMHYQRWRKDNRDAMRDNGRGVAAIDRLLSRCIEVDGCWVYQWPTDSSGYVRIRSGAGKAFGHRIAWEHFIGPWPEGLTFDHLCRNTSCVNPWHGEAVPLEVNASRNNNSIKTHCPQGHPLSGDNLRFASNGYGRVCRICRAESSAAYRNRLKETA